MIIDYSKPLTAVQVEYLKKIFRQVSGYNSAGDCIPAKELHAYLETCGYYRTPAEVNVIVQYFEDHFGGVQPWKEALSCWTNCHSNSKLAASRVAVFDTSGDGFISVDEFGKVWPLLSANNPRLKEISFEEFVMQADTNGDGKVSIEECAVWIDRINSNSDSKLA